MWVYNLTTPDPHSHIPRVIAICLVFPIVAFLAVLLRFYVRIIITKRAAWVDDYASLFSSVLALAYGAIAIAQTRWGLGLNAEYFPSENIVPFSRVQYTGGPVYTLALLGFKVSLLASYLRIGGFVKAYRVVIIGAILACVCNQLAFTFVLCFACRPVAKQWDFSIPGTCIDTLSSYYALAGTSLAFDIIIIALPLPVLMKLQLRGRQKAVLVGVFTLGFFVTVIQIIRIFTIKNLKTYTDSQAIVLWSVIEISLGVIISCIPTYGPLFHAFTANITSYRHRETYRLTSNRGTVSFSKKSASQQLGSVDHDRLFDHSIPNTTMIMSNVDCKTKVSSDGDSEERILPPQRSDTSTTLAPRERERDGQLQIHTMTEVRVESHNL